MLILVPVAVVTLSWFLDRTLIGKTGQGRVPPTPILGPALGHQPKMVSTMVWALAACSHPVDHPHRRRDLDRRRAGRPSAPDAGRGTGRRRVIAGMRSFRVTVLAAVCHRCAAKPCSLTTSSPSPASRICCLFIAVFGGRASLQPGARRRVGRLRLHPPSQPDPRAPAVNVIGGSATLDQRRDPRFSSAVAVVLPLVVTDPSPAAALHHDARLRHLRLVAHRAHRLGRAALAGPDGLRRPGAPCPLARLVTDGVPFWVAVRQHHARRRAICSRRRRRHRVVCACPGSLSRRRRPSCSP